MKFVTPQEVVYQRSVIAAAQAARAQTKRVPRLAQRGIAAPKLSQGTEVVKFIVINKKK